MTNGMIRSFIYALLYAVGCSNIIDSITISPWTHDSDSFSSSKRACAHLRTSGARG
jgi:hypothetical protein